MVEFFAKVPKMNLLYSALFIILGKMCLFLIAKYSLDKEGFRLPYPQVFFIVATTQLGKYIPGGVWHFVGRYNAYQNQEISIKKSTKAMISENFWLLSGAVVVGALFGINSELGKEILAGIGLSTKFSFTILYGLVIFILWILMLIVYEAILMRKFHPINILSFVKLISVQTITWFFLGISFLLVFPNGSVNLMPDVIFGYAISWVIGYVVIFAPGGIGVREGALVWIFSSLFLAENVLIYSTVHRFIYILVEFGLGIFSLVLRPALLRKSPNQAIADKEG